MRPNKQRDVKQATAFEKALALAIFEAPFIWGIGFMWYWGAAFEGHVFWSVVALLIFGGVLLIQLGVGAYYWISGLHHQSQFKNFITNRSVLHLKNDYSHSAINILQEWAERAVLGKRYEFRGKILIYALLLTLIAPLLIPMTVMLVVAIGMVIWGIVWSVIKILRSLPRWLEVNHTTIVKIITNKHIHKGPVGSDGVITKAIILGTLEGVILWGLLGFWYYTNAWNGGPFPPTLPLVLSGLVALQFVVGGISWRINTRRGEEPYWGKLFTVSGLAILAVPFEFALLLLVQAIL